MPFGLASQPTLSRLPRTLSSPANRAIKLRRADPRITADAGAILLGEADHRMGLTVDLAAPLGTAVASCPSGSAPAWVIPLTTRPTRPSRARNGAVTT